MTDFRKHSFATPVTILAYVFLTSMGLYTACLCYGPVTHWEEHASGAHAHCPLHSAVNYNPSSSHEDQRLSMGGADLHHQGHFHMEHGCLLHAVRGQCGFLPIGAISLPGSRPMVHDSTSLAMSTFQPGGGLTDFKLDSLRSTILLI
ncbi:hypothetical protein ACFL2Q_01510 [Thermodesulfobacteriota bacterium]